jgi:hypothetical protein
LTVLSINKGVLGKGLVYREIKTLVLKTIGVEEEMWMIKGDKGRVCVVYRVIRP